MLHDVAIGDVGTTLHAHRAHVGIARKKLYPLIGNEHRLQLQPLRGAQAYVLDVSRHCVGIHPELHFVVRPFMCCEYGVVPTRAIICSACVGSIIRYHYRRAGAPAAGIVIRMNWRMSSLDVARSSARRYIMCPER